MPASRHHSFTLVVFCGGILDASLATDFVMVPKKFMADGLDPTCLSGTHLRLITDTTGPFLFGRDDLGPRSQIYDSSEAANPFYHIAGPGGLKRKILNWVRNVSTRVATGDRVIIIFMAHGLDGSRIILKSQIGTEYLTRAEVTTALATLPQGIRVLLVNEACYSGSWATIAADTGSGRDVVVETAASIGEQSYNYRSASGRYRCSLFAAAFIEELTTHPEGRIDRHYTRIREEMRHVSPNQDSCTPLLVPSSRSLWSHNISHFVLTPNIATAIANLPSDQSRHKLLPQSCSRAQTFWASHRSVRSPGQGHANEASEGSDMELGLIYSYLDELGSAAAGQNRCTLASACHLVIDGRVGEDMKHRIVNTIAWQDTQMLRVCELVSLLVDESLISPPLDERACSELAKKDYEARAGLASRVHNIPGIKEMAIPPFHDDRYIDIVFDDAYGMLVDAVYCEQVLNPMAFDIGKIEATIAAFLQRSPAV
ncbi:hypothetical protein N7489_010129 [Penicillium chrysogenum]|uniref:uncharacterized protein n=1 Tax=Penicillium chrysogenum TaxID=5076 RepID=UPI0024DF1DA0|nr:uncharacterized protein N7489_010129 [Penicillium chrysogenum]KAJ5229421.1 hypothetical protein N7489_010129 [Penicillium chrysogenum]